MSRADLFEAMIPVLRMLERLGVRHYVGGSVASSAFGLPRTTLDADVVAVLELHHVDDFVAALANEFYASGPMIREAIVRESSFNVIHLSTMFKIDVFVAKSRDFDQSALSRIRRQTLGESGEELEVWLASPEDIVLSKLEWFRKGNEISERQWIDILGVLKVQWGNLDWDYLEHWATELSVLDLLKRARAEAAPQ